MHKNLLILPALVLCVGTLFAGGSADQAASDTDSPYAGAQLVISTWGFNMDTIEANVAAPFEERFGVDIVYETGNNSERFTRLATRRDNPNVDVVQLASNWAFRASEEGLLQPYDPARLPVLDQVYDWARDPFGNQHVVGYAISSYALTYRTDKTATPLTSWNDLAADDFAGFITLPDITTTFGPATVAMIALANGGDLTNVEPAWIALEALSDDIVTIYRRSSELVSLVQQEEVWAAPYSSFAWGNLAATELPVVSVVPQEGLAGSQSMVAIVAGSANADLAHEYINWLLSAEVQQAQAVALVDSPTNAQVRVPEDIAPLLTYGDAVIGNLVFFDEAVLAQNREAWIDRWNAIFSE